MDKTFRRALIVLALVFAVPGAVVACTCWTRVPVDKQFDEAEVVGIFKLRSMDLKPYTYEQPTVYTPTFTVEKVYKGDIRTGQSIPFQSNALACSFNFDHDSIGEEFLLFVSPNRPNGEKIWASGLCSTKPKNEAAAELLYLDKLTQVHGKTRLYGSVRSHNKVAVSGVIYEPIADLPVTVSGNGKIYSLKTDQNGVYEIYGLPPGEYRITPGALNGWIGELYNGSRTASTIVAIYIKAKAGTVQDIYYYPDSSIKGRLVDPSGKAVAHVQVRLVPAPGESLPSFKGNDIKTGVDGGFEFSRIPRGKYLIEVAGFDRKSAERPFDTFYYLNAEKRESAGRINIKPGQHIKDLDLTVPKMFEIVSFTGVLLYSDGKPVAGGTVGFFRDGENVDLKRPEEKTKTDSEGRFTLRVLKGQPGTLTALAVYTKRQASLCPDLVKALRKVGMVNPGTPKTVPSNAIGIETTSNVPDIELRFPFGFCSENPKLIPTVR